MRLRGLDKIDYRETRRNKERGTCATAAGQRRTASGRVTKTVPATPKRRAGRPQKSPSKPRPGRPRKQRAGPTSANGPSTIPKKSPRRSMRREYQPVSPIVKIVKKTATESPVSAPDDGSDAEHPSALMHRFFRAHGDEVANIPKKKQRKALGKLWRESPLNPKNARVQKESESANGAPRSDHDETNLDEVEVEEAVGDATVARTEGSGGDEAKIGNRGGKDGTV